MNDCSFISPVVTLEESRTAAVVRGFSHTLVCLVLGFLIGRADGFLFNRNTPPKVESPADINTANSLHLFAAETSAVLEPLLFKVSDDLSSFNVAVAANRDEVVARSEKTSPSLIKNAKAVDVQLSKGRKVGKSAVLGVRKAHQVVPITQLYNTVPADSLSVDESLNDNMLVDAEDIRYGIDNGSVSILSDQDIGSDQDSTSYVDTNTVSETEIRAYSDSFVGVKETHDYSTFWRGGYSNIDIRPHVGIVERVGSKGSLGVTDIYGKGINRTLLQGYKIHWQVYSAIGWKGFENKAAALADIEISDPNVLDPGVIFKSPQNWPSGATIVLRLTLEKGNTKYAGGLPLYVAF